MKSFSKKLLGHENYNFMVLKSTNIFWKKLKNCPTLLLHS